MRKPPRLFSPFYAQGACNFTDRAALEQALAALAGKNPAVTFSDRPDR